MTNQTELEVHAEESERSRPMRVFGWFSVGIGVAVVSFFVGRELRTRYRFKRRTPYDFYSNGSEEQNSDFPLGI